MLDSVDARCRLIVPSLVLMVICSQTPLFRLLLEASSMRLARMLYQVLTAFTAATLVKGLQVMKITAVELGTKQTTRG